MQHRMQFEISTDATADTLLQSTWDFDTNLLGGFEIDDEVKLHGLFDV
jgi:hypothetical protein